MKESAKKLNRHQRRAYRTRSRVVGSTLRPRLSVFRSNQHIYAQLIDDAEGRTLGTASSLKDKNGKAASAAVVGAAIAEIAKKLKIQTVVFDRGGYRYHGRVKALAEAAREHGLKF